MKKIILTAVITAVGVYFLTRFLFPNDISVKPPYFSANRYKFNAGDSFRCQSKVSMNLTNVFDTKISASLSRGIDEVSLRLNTDSMEVVSVENVRVGITQPTTYKIIYNDKSKIVAAGKNNDIAAGVGILVFSKETGLLLWTENGSALGGYSISDYYSCN